MEPLDALEFFFPDFMISDSQYQDVIMHFEVTWLEDEGEGIDYNTQFFNYCEASENDILIKLGE